MAKNILVMLMSVTLGFLPVRLGWAAETALIPITAFHLQEEQTHQSGVWTGGPQAIDEQIAFLLKTNRIESIEDYSHWLQNNITYEKNADQNEWQDPAKTLARRQGNCKNFASLSAEVLRVAGFKPLILVCWNQNKGHMICAFEANGYYCWLDNATLKKTTATSLAEFTSEMAQQYALSSLSKLNPQNNQWEILYGTPAS